MATGRGTSGTRGASAPGSSSDGPRRPSLALQPFAWNGLQILPLAPTAAESIAVVPPPLPALYRTAPFRVSEYDKRSRLAVAALEAALGLTRQATGWDQPTHPARLGTDPDSGLHRGLDPDPDLDLELQADLDLSDLAVPLPPGIGPAASPGSDEGALRSGPGRENSPSASPQGPQPSGAPGDGPALAAPPAAEGEAEVTRRAGNAAADAAEGAGSGARAGVALTADGCGGGGDGGASGSGGGDGDGGGSGAEAPQQPQEPQAVRQSSPPSDAEPPQTQIKEQQQQQQQLHEEEAAEQLTKEQQPGAAAPQEGQEDQEGAPPAKRRRVAPAGVGGAAPGGRPAARRGRSATAAAGGAGDVGEGQPQPQPQPAEQLQPQPQPQGATKRPRKRVKWADGPVAAGQGGAEADRAGDGAGAGGGGGGGGRGGRASKTQTQPETQPETQIQTQARVQLAQLRQERQRQHGTAEEVAAWWERLQGAATQLESLKAALQAAARQASPEYGTDGQQPGEDEPAEAEERAGRGQSGSSAPPRAVALDREEEERLLREELELGERARQRVLYGDPYDETEGKARRRRTAAAGAAGPSGAGVGGGVYGPPGAAAEESGEEGEAERPTGQQPQVPAAATAALERIRRALCGPDLAAAALAAGGGRLRGPGSIPPALEPEPGGRERSSSVRPPRDLAAAAAAAAVAAGGATGSEAVGAGPPSGSHHPPGNVAGNDFTCPAVDETLRDEVVVWVAVCGAGLPHVLHEEFLLLGSQSLDQLRDVMGCATEDAMREAAQAAQAAAAAEAADAGEGNGGGGPAAAAAAAAPGGRARRGAAPAEAAATARGRGRGRGGGRRGRGGGASGSQARGRGAVAAAAAPQDPETAVVAAAVPADVVQEAPVAEREGASGSGSGAAGLSSGAAADGGPAGLRPEVAAANAGAAGDQGSGDGVAGGSAASPTAPTSPALAPAAASPSPPPPPPLVDVAAAGPAPGTELPPSYGSYIFLEGHFYRDVRHPEAEDYTVPIRELFRAHGARPTYLRTERGWRPALARDRDGTGGPPPAALHTTRLTDMTLRLANQPVGVFCHRACCEHLLFVRDVRRWHPGDPPRRECFPLRLRARDLAGAPVARRRCGVCEAGFAELVTHDDPLAPSNPAIMCRHCFDLLHIGSGGERLAPSVMVQPYNPAMDIGSQGTWAISTGSWVSAPGGGGGGGGAGGEAGEGRPARVIGLRPPRR